MALFLSEVWFQEVDKLRNEIGDIEVPAAIQNVVINIVVREHPEGDKHFHVAAGDFQPGHHAAAPTKMTLPYEVAKGMFVQADQAVAMQAFMSGQIQVDGDMAVIMQMQAAGTPSEKARQLQERVRAMTEV